MKSFYLLFLLCLASLAGKAQNQPEQNCINGIPVCQSGYVQNNSYSGVGTIDELDATNQGCLGSGEENCVWYIIQVSVTGQLALSITPNNLGDDYDFAIWDISANGCQDIYDGGQPVACNYSPAPGITGTTATVPLPGPQWGPTITVTAGQTLALNVSNFSGSQSGYTLDFSASTASIFDIIPPRFKSSYVRCGYTTDSLDVTMTESIKCSSIDANGSNFEVVSGAAGTVVPPGTTVISAVGLNCTPPNSLTRDIRIKFSNILPPGTYYVRSKIGTSGGTLQDPCSNNISTGLVPDSIAFTMVAPVPPEVKFVQPPSCISAKIGWDRKIECATVAANGSDFTITGPAPVNIVRVDKSQCDSMGLTDSLTLFFEESVALPGVYTLGFKTGTDGDGITDTCGKEANVPFNFVVSDVGVTATATPAVLCAPGYTELTAVPLNPPSNYIPVCGTAQGPFTSTNTINANIGAGTTISDGGTTYTPFNGFWENARTQMIYKAADLLAGGLLPGRIDQMAFDIATKGTTIPYSGFTLKMSCTALNDLSNGFVPGLPIVYGPVSYTTTNGINTFPLNTVYEWDGVQNIIVELCFSNTSYTGYDQVRYTTNPNTTDAVFHRYQDAGPAGCTFSSTEGNGGAGSALPNIRFRATTPPPGGYFLLWKPGTAVFDSTAANTRAFVEKDKNFIVQIKDTFQCFRRDTVRVIIPPRFPKADPNNDTSICIGGSARLLVSGGETFNWFPPTGLSCTACPNPIASPTTTTTYFVSIADQYGCADTLKNTVVVNPLPVVRASADTFINWGSSAQLYVFSPGANYFLWTPINGLNNANSPAPIAAPLETTEYRVEVIDSNYCIAYDTVVVEVNKNSPMFVPNAFTPNGDDRNDRFQVVNIAFNNLIELRVFNRWGQQVCYTTDNRQGWDGTLGGTPQPPDVYQYVIRVAMADGTVRAFKGNVTLIR